jgi:hypothetical protein
MRRQPLRARPQHTFLNQSKSLIILLVPPVSSILRETSGSFVFFFPYLIFVGNGGVEILCRPWTKAFTVPGPHAVSMNLSQFELPLTGLKTFSLPPAAPNFLLPEMAPSVPSFGPTILPRRHNSNDEPPLKRQKVDTPVGRECRTGTGFSRCPASDARRWTRQVCFGMVGFVHPLNDAKLANGQEINVLTVDLFNSGSLVEAIGVSICHSRTVVQDTTPIGQLSQTASELLHELQEDDDIELQMRCRNTPDHGPMKKIVPTAQLLVIIYGEFERLEDIGDFCRESGIYLQDLIECNRTVEYRNSHRLSALDEDVSMTSIGPPAAPSHSEFMSSSVKFLEGFENGESLPEMEDPPLLCTPLHKHQRQALSFMMAREQGWSLNNPMQDIWSRTLCSTGSTLLV